MKRLIGLSGFLTTAIALALGIFITIPQTLPDPARAALNQYLNYRYDSSTELVTIKFITRANMPTLFTRAMSGASIGASNFFGTNVDYRRTLVNLPSLTTPTPAYGGPTYLFASMGNPIPFPPEDVWCVLLTDSEAHLIFITLHQTLYNADWIVHEPPGDWSAADLSQTLSSIGCDLKSGSYRRTMTL
jgi:hypothetical protein